MSVSTKKVRNRRTLRFETYDDLSAEVDRLAASPVRCLGNWSFGQNCRHLAVVMNKSIDGFGFRAPWPVRLAASLLKGRILERGLWAGAQLPAIGKELLPDPVEDAAGVSELRTAIARLQRETPMALHPVFGPLTPHDWLRIHLRHAELHLSFVEPL